MPVVSSMYWNMVHGTKAEDVEKDLEGLQTMRTIAQNMAWLLKSIKQNPIPTGEDKVKTNFIK